MYFLVVMLSGSFPLRKVTIPIEEMAGFKLTSRGLPRRRRVSISKLLNFARWSSRGLSMGLIDSTSRHFAWILLPHSLPLQLVSGRRRETCCNDWMWRRGCAYCSLYVIWLAKYVWHHPEKSLDNRGLLDRMMPTTGPPGYDNPRQ